MCILFLNRGGGALRAGGGVSADFALTVKAKEGDQKGLEILPLFEGLLSGSVLFTNDLWTEEGREGGLPVGLFERVRERRMN